MRKLCKVIVLQQYEEPAELLKELNSELEPPAELPNELSETVTELSEQLILLQETLPQSFVEESKVPQSSS